MTTRTLAAAAIVGVLVAATAVVVVVSTVQHADAADAARRAQRIAADIATIRGDVVELRRSSAAGDEGDVAGARDLVRRRWAALEGELRDEPSQAGAARAIDTDLETLLVVSSPARTDRLAAAAVARLDRVEARQRGIAAARADAADAEADDVVIAAVAGAGCAVLLIVLLALYEMRSIVAPMRRLGAAARRVEAGDLGARAPVTGRAEMRELAVAFNSMATSLEERTAAARESERLKDEFFALVSHELRTPLTSILGYVELLSEEAGPDGSPELRRQYAEVLARNAQRLLRLVGDLLFAAQVEMGRPAIQVGPVDLRAVAAGAVEAARPAAEARDIALRLVADDVAPFAGDAERLGQALDNLVSNAIKFTPPGGEVTVRAGVQRQRLPAGSEGAAPGRDDDVAILEVSDTGPGVPEAERERIFERFHRGSQATAEGVPGIGLGLTIVRAIADAHDGRVTAGPRADGRSGATFRIELPLRPPPPADAPAATRAARAGA